MIDLSRAKYNKPVPKNRFKEIKLEGVDTIKWLYKISADTADFRHSDAIIEIQVFEVIFKNGQAVKRDIITIQKEIPYPILFISHGKNYFIAEGELLESDREFLNDDTLMIERRSAKLTELYEDIVAAFVPIKRWVTESIAEFIVRYKRLQAMEREIAMLQRKVDGEKQPNKRIELNEKLKQLKAEKENTILC
jgi:hypothetical protein